MNIDQNTVALILTLIGGGIVTALVQAIKKWLKIEGGWPAAVLALVLSFVGTAYVLVSTGSFSVIALLLYSAVVFGESTGLYHLTGKKTG